MVWDFFRHLLCPTWPLGFVWLAVVQTNSNCLWYVTVIFLCVHMLGLSIATLSQNVYTLIYIYVIDWVAICTRTRCLGFKHLILYIILISSLSLSLWSLYLLLTLAFVNQTGGTSFCRRLGEPHQAEILITNSRVHLKYISVFLTDMLLFSFFDSISESWFAWLCFDL